MFKTELTHPQICFINSPITVSGDIMFLCALSKHLGIKFSLPFSHTPYYQSENCARSPWPVCISDPFSPPPLPPPACPIRITEIGSEAGLPTLVLVLPAAHFVCQLVFLKCKSDHITLLLKLLRGLASQNQMQSCCFIRPYIVTFLFLLHFSSGFGLTLVTFSPSTKGTVTSIPLPRTHFPPIFP